MERAEFIKAASAFCSENEARALAASYTDIEIKESGKEIISELEEDFRFCANVNHYQRCGY